MAREMGTCLYGGFPYFPKMNGICVNILELTGRTVNDALENDGFVRIKVLGPHSNSQE